MKLDVSGPDLLARSGLSAVSGTVVATCSLSGWAQAVQVRLLAGVGQVTGSSSFICGTPGGGSAAETGSPDSDLAC